MKEKINKPFWKSRTVWGFGLAVLIAFAQANGVVADTNTVAEIIQALSAVLGIIGARQAIK